MGLRAEIRHGKVIETKRRNCFQSDCFGSIWKLAGFTVLEASGSSLVSLLCLFSVKRVQNCENSERASKCFQIAKTVSFQMLPNSEVCFLISITIWFLV